MKKRILALLLVISLLIGAVPTVFAEDYQTEEERITELCLKTFRQALYASGRKNFKGYCGLQTGYSTWKLGITEIPEVFDGNDYYDYYKYFDYTTNGHKINCYGAKQYTMEEAFNAATQNGTRNIYNIIVCFQRTNTVAGSRYGHALLVQAVLDGYVYFLEDFQTLGPARTVVKCTIQEFSDYYCSWAQFEGIIVMGEKTDADLSAWQGTDLLVVSKGAKLLSAPNGEAVVRDALKGEVFHATAVLTAPDGNAYYRVGDGYVAVSGCEVQRVNTENVTGEVTLPEVIKPGKKFSVSGKILSPYSELAGVRLNVLDGNGEVVQTVEVATRGHMEKLSNVSVKALEEGIYKLQVCVDAVNAGMEPAEVVVQETWFGVGQEVEDAPEVDAPEIPDGWNYIDGVRYFYQNGAPRVGWYCDNGLDYYFTEDGSVTTGWMEINGRWRCFTDTGVMRTSWVEAPEGTYYMLSNGVAAIGEKVIDGVTYNFNDDGLLIVEEITEE